MRQRRQCIASLISSIKLKLKYGFQWECIGHVGFRVHPRIAAVAGALLHQIRPRAVRIVSVVIEIRQIRHRVESAAGIVRPVGRRSVEIDAFLKFRHEYGIVGLFLWIVLLHFHLDFYWFVCVRINPLFLKLLLQRRVPEVLDLVVCSPGSCDAIWAHLFLFFQINFFFFFNFVLRLWNLTNLFPSASWRLRIKSSSSWENIPLLRSGLK